MLATQISLLTYKLHYAVCEGWPVSPKIHIALLYMYVSRFRRDLRGLSLAIATNAFVVSTD